MNTRKPPILVFGFSHSGTSILKSIIGHSEGVYEFPYETSEPPLVLSVLEGKDPGHPLSLRPQHNIPPETVDIIFN